MLLLRSKDTNEISTLKKTLNARFKMIDLSSVHHYLDMKVIRDRTNRTLHISQRAYLEKMLERFEMQNCKLDITSISTSVHLVSETDHQTSKTEIRFYQFIIEFLMYAMVQTRPDIVYAVSVLSRFSTNPNHTHMTAAKHVLRYLKGTLYLSITYDEGNSLLDYTDVD